MKLIARRGPLQAWADEPFDPATDEVELRTDHDDIENTRVLWQQALKFGYWEEA